MAYFTTPEFRQFMPDMAEPAYPDERVDLARAAVESLIEQVCGTAFEATAYTETVDGSGKAGLLLSQPYVQSITSVTVDGVLLTGYTYTFTGGMLERVGTASYTPTVWTRGRRNIAVAYTAGWPGGVPDDLKLAAMLAVRDRVLMLDQRSGKPSDRSTSVSTDVGTFALSIASEGNPTGNPDVDATIMRWARAVRVPTVA